MQNLWKHSTSAHSHISIHHHWCLLISTPAWHAWSLSPSLFISMSHTPMPTPIFHPSYFLSLHHAHTQNHLDLSPFMPTSLSSFLVVHLSFEPITAWPCMAASCSFHAHAHFVHDVLSASRVSCCLLGGRMRFRMVTCALPSVHGLRAVASMEKWGFVSGHPLRT